MDDLLQEFIAETRETLEALSGEIVAWEAQPGDSARLDAIFRFVHTVKGSCGFLDLPRLGRLSHAAEDVLAQVRVGERVPDRALVNSVLAVVDRIGELVEAIESGASLDASGDELLIAALAEGTQEVAQASGPAAPRAAARSVRLNVDLLDRMMSGMSDMVLARNELARRLRQGDIDPAIEAALERLSMTVGEMRDTVTRTRMQKIDALFSALPRMVRDTAAGLRKSVTLHVDGSDVELDREMIEVMRDPLVHIIRNSIDHGIEAPNQRRAAGKRENGRLSVAARQSGNQIIIEIADDGRGIDTEKLIAKLVAGGRDEQQLRRLSDRAKLALVFEPGLSSKDEVSEVSGRGVGMDVVRAAIEQIGGRIELDSAPGKGLRIAIHVPLTLSIISAIVVGVGSQRFAISRQAIEEIVTERSDAIRIDTLGGTRIATVRDRRMPVIDLSTLLGVERSEEGIASGMLAIVSVSDGSYALAVDTVLDNEELVVKPASPAVMSTGLYAGQTLPDSGLPMLMLDCAGMAQVAALDFSREASEAFDEEAPKPEAVGTPALLFRDLDGVRRAVPLEAVDRVEQVEGSAVRFAAGRFRVTIDGRILPLAAQGSMEGREKLSVLRLKDGDNEVSYAIDEAIDIILLPEELVPAREPGPIAGVALIDGEQIELLDMLWVFDEHADRAGDASGAPLCLIAGDSDGWMRSFVRPMLETAGYRVVTSLNPGDVPAVVLAAEGDVPGEVAKAPLVRLRRHRSAAGVGDDSVYRYDRAGLLCALEARMSGGGLR